MIELPFLMRWIKLYIVGDVIMVLSLKWLQVGDDFMYIGIDLGGTNIKLGLLNENLGVQKKLKVATQSETNSQTDRKSVV